MIIEVVLLNIVENLFDDLKIEFLYYVEYLMNKFLNVF